MLIDCFDEYIDFGAFELNNIYLHNKDKFKIIKLMQTLGRYVLSKHNIEYSLIKIRIRQNTGIDYEMMIIFYKYKKRYIEYKEAEKVDIETLRKTSRFLYSNPTL